MNMSLTRRGLIAAAAAGLAVRARAGEAIRIGWEDLAPASGRAARRFGVIGHDEGVAMSRASDPVAFTSAYDGKIVTLPGFAIPLDFDGLGTTVMILAPFIGACIHVPPPPPNQLVLVEAEEPYAVEELFEPVLVTGRFSRFDADTELAEIGYRLRATAIAPFEG